MTEQGTRLGPLTTTFTLPPQCTVAVAGPPHAWLGQSCGPSAVLDATSCWPPKDRAVPAPKNPLAGWGFYSPGIICPAGHTSACSATAGARGGFPFQFSLAAQETAVGCCPVGYKCTVQNSGWQTCLFDKENSSGEIQTVTCDEGKSVGLGVLTMPRATIDVWAPLIQINFQPSDLPAVSSSSTSTGQGPPPTGPAGSETSGVSTGAIAGIAVGAVVIILGILGAALFVWRRKRAQRREDGFSQFDASPADGRGDVASAQHYTPLGTYPQEIGGDPRRAGGVPSPAYSDRSGAGPGTGTNGAQEGKYYYSGPPVDPRSTAVEADGRPVAAAAPGTGMRPTELAG